VLLREEVKSFKKLSRRSSFRFVRIATKIVESVGEGRGGIIVPGRG
jgi:hypothetical protein